LSSKFSLSSLFDRDFVAKAEELERKGQLEKAAETFAKAKLPERSAELWVRSGEIDRAVEVYRGAGLERRAAELLLENDRVREAVSLFEAAGEYERAAETCLTLRSPQRLRAGRLFEQAGLYRRAVDIFTQAGDLEHALGALELESNRLKSEAAEGADLTREIGEIDLKRVELQGMLGHHLEAGRLLAEMGAHERAAELFEKDGHFAEAARAYLAAGNPERALGALPLARDLDAAERQKIYAEAAELYRREGKLAEAGRTFAEAGELVLAGEQYLDAGDLDAARSLLEEVSEESPEIVPASLLLVSVLLKTGDPEAAQERLQNLVEHAEEGEVPEVELFYWEGRINEELSDYSRAEDCYERVVATSSDFRDTTERLREVRGKIPALDTSGFTSEHEEVDDPHKTGPVHLDDTEAAPAAPASRATEPAAPKERPSATDGELSEAALSFAALPYSVDEVLEPWWPGILLVRATELASHKPALLISLYQAGLGAWVDSFRRIARDLVALEAPAILKLDDVLLTEEQMFLRYEAFSGEPLMRWLTRERPLPLKALHLLAQVCEALATAHKLGVAHRWLSPRTVLIGPEMRVKVLGFGLRELVGEPDSTTEAYFSPEAHAGQTVGPSADVYAVGLLGVELLGAMVPSNLMRAESPDPSRVGWPPEVEELVPAPVLETLLRCLARNPVKRPAAEELRRALSSLGMVPGQVIDDRYEILGELGRGGMSRVYRARDRLLDSEVAIKTLLTPVGAQGEDKIRLLREAQISLRITHPNVVRVYDAREFPNGVFLIMELLDGLGLDEILRYEAPLELARSKKILSEVAAALAEAHALNVVHRDLKPGNVFVLAGGRTKVMDFGIARSYERSSQLTRAGEVIGSPMYMAPEQIQGLPLDGTCDLYALGVIAFTMLTGREPFLGTNANAVVIQHLNEAPPELTTLNPEVPEEWAAMVGKLLSKKPRDRYPSAQELSAVIAGLPE